MTMLLHGFKGFKTTAFFFQYNSDIIRFIHLRVFTGFSIFTELCNYCCKELENVFITLQKKFHTKVFADYFVLSLQNPRKRAGQTVSTLFYRQAKKDLESFGIGNRSLGDNFRCFETLAGARAFLKTRI